MMFWKDFLAESFQDNLFGIGLLLQKEGLFGIQFDGRYLERLFGNPYFCRVEKNGGLIRWHVR